MLTLTVNTTSIDLDFDINYNEKLDVSRQRYIDLHSECFVNSLNKEVHKHLLANKDKYSLALQKAIELDEFMATPHYANNFIKVNVIIDVPPQAVFAIVTELKKHKFDPQYIVNGEVFTS